MASTDSKSDSKLSTSSSNKKIKEYSMEAQPTEEQQPVSSADHTASASVKSLYLAIYFFLNLALTLSNKTVLKRASCPWLLTTLHASATSVGCGALMATGQLKLTKLGTREKLSLVAFSLLFTLNIAISNVSLAMVSVPFHQIMRSLCPVATILIYRTVYSRTHSTMTYLSMIPLVLGVGMATVGDYQFAIVGFMITALGVLLASIKTVATNRLMTGNRARSAIEILFYMSPLAAAQCLLYAAASGEISSLRSTARTFEWSFTAALTLNAHMAFALNIISFQTNKYTGALALSVCGNVKQCLTILLGIALFKVEIGPVNTAGMIVTVLGAAWYSKVELDTKRARSRCS